MSFKFYLKVLISYLGEPTLPLSYLLRRSFFFTFPFYSNPLPHFLHFYSLTTPVSKPFLSFVPSSLPATNFHLHAFIPLRSRTTAVVVAVSVHKRSFSLLCKCNPFFFLGSSCWNMELKCVATSFLWS